MIGLGSDKNSQLSGVIHSSYQRISKRWREFVRDKLTWLFQRMWKHLLFITALTAMGQSTSQVELVIPGEVEVHEVFAFNKQVLDNLAHHTCIGYFYMDTLRPPAYWIVPKLRKYPALKFQFLLTFLTCSTRCSNSDRLFFTASSRFSPFVSGSCTEFITIFYPTQVQSQFTQTKPVKPNQTKPTKLNKPTSICSYLCPVFATI